MHSLWRTIVKGVAWIGGAMVVIVVLHLGGVVALHVGQFSPLTGAFIGGILVLSSVLLPRRRGENTEAWIGHEQLGWALIGLGVMMWGFGETFWRYYVAIGQTPFPSTADIGYASFPLLVFTGLLLQPSSESGGKRFLLLMDSLIAMGSILAIAWELLLGALAQAPGEANLAKFLGLYYPIADTALLSCVVFLLLRNQGSKYQANARRMGMLGVGLGLCFFVFSDFIFNVQNNAGTYVEATWLDLGWPLGLMTIGVAAYLRRFLPATPAQVIEQRMQQHADDARELHAFGVTRFVPYILLALLFLTLTFNVLSSDPAQLAIRPVLLFATMGVVALVVTRQIFTLWENARLAREQAEALVDLEKANKRIEEQSRQIADHNAELERGIEHLKDVQAQLANGNLRARASLRGGALLPLAGSLNLMAERLMRLGQANIYIQRLMRALGELSVAFERKAAGAPFVIPETCNEFVEINRLLLSMRVKGNAATLPHSMTRAPLRPPVMEHPDQPLTHNATNGLPPTPMPRHADTPPPLNPQVSRLGIRTVSGSRQPLSSGPLQTGMSKDDEWE